MIASIFTSLPVVVASVISIGVTVFVCRLWFKAYYVHRSEVKPLQESQHIMQNQYAILAERIKHGEAQLGEAKAKLETYEATGKSPLEFENFKTAILAEIRNISQETSSSGETDQKVQEQINFIRQNIKEFRFEFAQKINTANSQNQELASRLSELMELNKKLAAEAETISQFLQPDQEQEGKPEKLFTLASIKKRS